MSERNEEYFQQFVGHEIETSIYRVSGKKMSKYAEAIGDMNPIYHPKPPKAEGEKPDYSEVIAHPAYAATYTIPGLFKIADVRGSDGELMIKNVGKLLHTGQEYDFEGCDPLRPSDKKVYTDAVVSKIWIKSKILWIQVKLTSRNKDKSKVFCKTTLTVGIRPGGY